MNESRHTPHHRHLRRAGTSRDTHKRVMSFMIESRHAEIIHVSLAWMSHVTHLITGTRDELKPVVSRINESCLSYDRVMSCTNETCLIWMSHVTHGIAGTGDRVGHVNIPAAKRPHWNGLIQIGLQGTLESTAGLGTDIQIFMYHMCMFTNIHMHTRISVCKAHWKVPSGSVQIYIFSCIACVWTYTCAHVFLSVIHTGTWR